jgi:hypothetical protein
MNTLTENPQVSLEELQALRIQVQQLDLKVQTLEAEKNALEIFTWNVVQQTVAFADRNRWLTGVDLDEAKKAGNLPEGATTTVNNDTSWVHFQENGVKKVFDAEFKNPDGSRNFPKLLKKFPSFLKNQVV